MVKIPLENNTPIKVHQKKFYPKNKICDQKVYLDNEHDNT